MDKLRFMDIVVLSVFWRLQDELGAPPTHREVMESYNEELQSNSGRSPYLKRRCIPFKSATNMTSSTDVLVQLGLMSTKNEVDIEAAQRLNAEMQERFGSDFMEWPEYIPYSGNVIKWDDAVLFD